MGDLEGVVQRLVRCLLPNTLAEIAPRVESILNSVLSIDRRSREGGVDEEGERIEEKRREENRRERERER